jgi:predicted RNA-binding Zn-ribbon protein involved in translation (DUF1610 family)
MTDTTGGSASCVKCGAELFRHRPVAGFVYVFSHPKMPGLLKIGFTSARVEDRAQELSGASGVPGPFTIEACFPTDRPEEHERAAHRLLSKYRVQSREFFEIDLHQALLGLMSVIGSPPSFLRTPLATSEVQILTCRRCSASVDVHRDWGVNTCPRCGSGAITLTAGTRSGIIRAPNSAQRATPRRGGTKRARRG